MTRPAPQPLPDAQLIAVLGPTNTGKTHYAIERMLARADGIIGLPLRLLAREVYDKVVELRGRDAAALITGEEKILPARARYFICTVEAMPLDRMVDFVAIDEIQMCADPERGHIFTDRLLRARGRYETLFLGSDAARARIASLVPGVRFVGRERFSTLSHAGPKKISRLKPRSAIVAFSIDQVYAIAELIRRQRGGAAVVMGALSPRTRNAQVALYQQGDVDYLVATDAIGMGLNLDIDHVAFAGLGKFDGHRHRRLEANELAQIAGRAGRHTRDGSFGVTGEAPPLEDEIVDAIESHRFKPVQRLMWRNPDLHFGSVPALMASLDEPPRSPDLARGREADDQLALRHAWEDPEIRRLAGRPDRVRLLWEVCQIPDFRKVAGTDHAQLVGRIYRFLLGARGVIPSDWIAGQVRRIDRADGDIDALAKRLAYIRTWTFVANRADWLEDAPHWQDTTRAVEDRLSDALHARLTQRFVDRRTSVLMRRLKQKERLVAEVNDKGEVTVEGEYLGRLDGFRFTVDPSASPDEIKTLRSASTGALVAELARRADKLYMAPDTEFDVTEQGGFMWGDQAVGQLLRGDGPLGPRVRAFVDDSAEPAVAEKIERRLGHWIERRIKAQFEPVLKLRDDEAVTGLARGVAFQIAEAMGVLPRRQIAEDIKALGQEERALLRKHGVRFGQYSVFLPQMLKPAPTRLRLLLWALWSGLEEFPVAPPPGQVTVPAGPPAPAGFWEKAGYRLCGARAVRVDMLERLADMIRQADAKAGFEASPEMLSITGCTLEQFAEIAQGLGYAAEKGERPRTAKPAARPGRGGRAAQPAADAAVAAADATPGEPPAAEIEAEAADAPEVHAPPEAQAGTAPETPAEQDAGREASPAPAQAEEASAETPTAAQASAEAGTAPPPAHPAGEGDTPPSEPAEMETYYLFTLRPRRPQGERRRGPAPGGRGAPAGGETGEGQAQRSRPRPRRGGGPGEETRADAGPGRERRQGEAGPARERRQGEGERPRGKPAHAEGRGDRPGGPPRGGKGQGPRPPREDGAAESRGQGRPRREDKPFDPDSPFAILQQLKNK